MLLLHEIGSRCTARRPDRDSFHSCVRCEYLRRDFGEERERNRRQVRWVYRSISENRKAFTSDTSESVTKKEFPGNILSGFYPLHLPAAGYPRRRGINLIVHNQPATSCRTWCMTHSHYLRVITVKSANYKKGEKIQCG